MKEQFQKGQFMTATPPGTGGRVVVSKTEQLADEREQLAAKLADIQKRIAAYRENTR